MKKLLIITAIILHLPAFSQEEDTLKKKKEAIKMDLMYGYYQQNGDNSPVTGGIGTEQLDNHAPFYVVSIPLKDTSSVNVNFGVDHYSSASTLNINRYVSAASTGTSSVSGQDTRIHGDGAYTFRENKIDHKFKFGFSTEYDVLSFNAGYGVQIHLKKYDQKLTFNINTYWDRWLLIYPGELDPLQTNSAAGYGYGGETDGSSQEGSGSGGDDSGSGGDTGSGNDDDDNDSGSGNNNNNDDDNNNNDDDDDDNNNDDDDDDGSGSGEFVIPGNVFVSPLSGSAAGGYTEAGTGTDLTGKERYEKDWRKTFNFSAQHSFTINKRMKMATNMNVIFQNGLLSTPFHRVYFNDGVIDEINKLVRVENLPHQRLKLALSFRHNYFVNRYVVLKSMVRLYGDSWDSKAITTEMEVALKMSKIITFYPFYRFHFQTAVEYFAPYGRQEAFNYYYTSDFDLSRFTAHKYGLGLRLNPIYDIKLAKGKRSDLVLDSFDMRIGSYVRSTGLKAQTISFGLHFKINPKI